MITVEYVTVTMILTAYDVEGTELESWHNIEGLIIVYSLAQNVEECVHLMADGLRKLSQHVPVEGRRQQLASSLPFHP